MLTDITDDTGNIITKKLNGFIKNYEPALRKYNLYDSVRTLKSAQGMVDEATNTLTLFNRSAAARALGASPENVVGEIFRGRDMVDAAKTTRHILDTIKSDKAAVSGLRTAVKDHIMKQAEKSS